MRVIAGKYRGRRLRGPKERGVRPTSDRLKETLFDILGPDVQGASCLDVFAGSGAIGLEALSRGAAEAVFIESSPACCELIRANLSLCGVSTGYRLIRMDAFGGLRSLSRSGFRAAIIFLDPPYEFEPYRDLLKILFGGGLAGPGTTVVVEHHARTSLPDAGAGYRRTRQVRQGDKCLSFYRAQAGSSAGGPSQPETLPSPAM